MVSQVEELERQYCPPLDTSTFYAIVSDFNLDKQDELNDAKATLDALRASASADDTVGFDPSGSYEPKDPGNVLSSPTSEADVLSNESTDPTDVTSSLDAFTFEEPDTYDKGIDAMTDEEKQALLKEMFRGLKPFDIEFMFKKKRGDFGAVVEELLNQQFLEEEARVNGSGPSTPKGVDGFASSEMLSPRPKGKSKGRKKKGAAAAAAAAGSNAPSSLVDLHEQLVDGLASSANRWQKAADDVKFVTDRTELSEVFVKSIYNSTGRHSLRETLVAICKKPREELRCTADPEDGLVQTSIVDLASEYPSAPLPYLTTIILLTHPVFIAAKELAAVLVSGPKESIIPQYASTKIPSHDDPDHEAGTLADITNNGSSSSSNFLAISTNLPLPLNRSYDSLRATAFAQASAAYRKSRSAPAMGGAAAYYASVGHAANVAMKRERALEANARVAQQSAPGTCDLHFVTVDDARRIAKQYVERWWADRQEWAREGKAMDGGGTSSSEFRIIVGRGAHSADKKGRLGPAVAKMLKEQGWRVDEQVGEIVVRGKVRR